MTDGEFPRQWNLSRLLCSQREGLTVADLAKLLHVTDRTIKRDLAVLRAVEIPLMESVGPHGVKRYRVEIDQSRMPHLNYEEVAALWLGRRFLDPLAGTGLWRAALQAFKKLEQIFPPSARDYLNKMATSIHQTAIGSSDYTQRAESIDTLLMAIEDHTCTKITYHSLNSDSPQPVEIHPLGFLYHEGSLYLVAFAVQHKQLRHYKVDRLHAVELLSSKFVPPAGFSLDDHFAQSFGVFHTDDPLKTVRIRFSPEAARYVQEHRWHHSQRLTPCDNGTLECEMQLANLTEVRSWVLSFGPRAEVLAPPELRAAIQEDLRRLQEVYA